MAAMANPLVSVRGPRLQALSGGYTSKASDMSLIVCHPLSVSIRSLRRRKAGAAGCNGQFFLRAAHRESGSPGNAVFFIGGFVLGGTMAGTLACVYAPQISKALTGTDKKDPIRKLPKFIYSEEKASEKTRKALAEKIAQLNAAIDDVSSQLQPDDEPNGVAVTSDEFEAAI
ncbi:hypothetical protein MUK42_01335 [Musa troglodytarum]|uniref:Uncharacterized protein n=1 Tax=Musa troglodytarum TaxID=320322 RepID=A0A9E7FGY3_9LILI|nr:hypothetical protein MUK42_01335 [Musa troglodytarum]